MSKASPNARDPIEDMSQSFIRDPLPVGLLVYLMLRFWVLIFGTVLLCAGIGWGLSRFAEPIYTARSVQLVKGVPGTGISANYEAAQSAARRAKSYPTFIYSEPVLEGVKRDLGGDETLAALRQDLTAANPADTPLIQIDARGDTPEAARNKANSAARQLAQFITQIETVSGRSPVTVDTVVPAVAPASPTSPKPGLFAALGAMFGFAFGLIASLVVEHRKALHPYASGATSDEDPFAGSPPPDDGPTDRPSTDLTATDGQSARHTGTTSPAAADTHGS